MPAFKDAGGTYWATMVSVVPYMYNTEKVAAADIPNAAMDFLKPQFKGKIVTAYPADDDVTLWVFYHIVQKYGWSYMDKYMAQKPNFIQGHLGEQRSIGSGQTSRTFDSILDITDGLKRQGQPVETHIPTGDALPIWPLTGAIFKDAPHPNAAKLFLSWLLAPEQQSKLPTWSPRSDVPPPAGFKPIFSYKVANDYVAFLTDQSKVADCASASRATAARSSIPAACGNRAACRHPGHKPEEINTAARCHRPWCATSAAARSRENRCARATSNDYPTAGDRQRARRARRRIRVSRRDRKPR